MNERDVQQETKHRHFAEDERGAQKPRRPAVNRPQEKCKRQAGCICTKGSW